MGNPAYAHEPKPAFHMEPLMGFKCEWRRTSAMNTPYPSVQGSGLFEPVFLSCSILETNDQGRLPESRDGLRAGSTGGAKRR